MKGLKNQQMIDSKEKILKNLIKSRANWINEKGPLSDVVVSSRIRLTRNINNIPFTSRAIKWSWRKYLKWCKKYLMKIPFSVILIISHWISYLPWKFNF